MLWERSITCCVNRAPDSLQSGPSMLVWNQRSLQSSVPQALAGLQGPQPVAIRGMDGSMGLGFHTQDHVLLKTLTLVGFFT